MSPDVTPIPKPVKREKAPRRNLPRVGRKMTRDRDELEAVRPILLERSGGKCEAQVAKLCTSVGQHAHHIQRRAQSGSNDPENLLWVCHFCHDWLHYNPQAAAELGMIRRMGDPGPDAS
jgi:hypothetical protein